MLFVYVVCLCIRESLFLLVLIFSLSLLPSHIVLHLHTQCCVLVRELGCLCVCQLQQLWCTCVYLSSSYIRDL